MSTAGAHGLRLCAGDVGLARIMDATHLATGLAPCGTFAYAAPEMLMGTRCSEKVLRLAEMLWLRKIFVSLQRRALSQACSRSSVPCA